MKSACAFACTAFAVLSACASQGRATAGEPPSIEPTFAFPIAFTAQQIVDIELAGRTEHFVARLTLDGHAISVVLMEPLFLSPLAEFSRASSSDRIEEHWYVPKPEGARFAPRLVNVLAALYADSQWRRTEQGSIPANAAPRQRAFVASLPAASGQVDAWTGEGPQFTADLEGVPRTGACRFPERVVLHPSLGPAKRVAVRTQAVRCNHGVVQ